MDVAAIKKCGILMFVLLLALAFTACDMITPEAIEEVLKDYTVTVTLTGVAQADLEDVRINVTGNDISNRVVTPEKSTISLSGLKGSVSIQPVHEDYRFDPASAGVTISEQGQEVVFKGMKTGDAGDEEVTGVLNQVLDYGNKVKIGDVVYPVTPDSHLLIYFDQLDDEILGSTVTVRMQEGLVVQLVKIVLQDKVYDELAFNTLTNPDYDNYPSLIIGDGDLNRPDRKVRGVEIVGYTAPEGEKGTTIRSAGLHPLSDVDGVDIEVVMERVKIRNIGFDVRGIILCTDHALLELKSLTGNLVIGCFCEGCPFPSRDNSLNTAFSSSSLASKNVVSVANGVFDGHVMICGYENTIKGEVIKGDLQVSGENTNLDIDEVQGDVTLNEPVNIDDLTFGSSLTLGFGAKGLVVDGITVPGDFIIVDHNITVRNSSGGWEVPEISGDNILNRRAEGVQPLVLDKPYGLQIRGDNVTIEDSSFGALLAGSNGQRATLENVAFEKIFPTIKESAPPFVLRAGETFKIDAVGWRFRNVEWPLDNDFHVEITRNDIVIEDMHIKRSLTIDSKDVKIVDSSFGSLANKNTGTNVTLENVEFDEVWCNLFAEDACPLEEGGTFTINRDGWTFDRVTFPVERFSLEIINCSNSSFIKEGPLYGNATINATSSAIQVAGDIEGDVCIKRDYNEVTAETVTGSLTVEGTCHVLGVEQVDGNVTLNNSRKAFIDHITFGSNLILAGNLNDLVISGIAVPGTLLVENGQPVNVTIQDSSFGALANVNNGSHVALERVSFEKVYPTLGADDAVPLREGGTFVISHPNWTFDEVDFPVAAFGLTIPTVANNVTFIKDSPLQGNLVIDGNDAFVEVEGDFEGDVTICGNNAVVRGQNIKGELGVHGEDAVLEVVSVEALATFTESATIDGIKFKQGLTLGGPGTYKGLQIDGTLMIGADDVTLANSTVGLLAAEHDGINATFQDVIFKSLHVGLDNCCADLLAAGGTFTVNKNGWVFDNVTWPLDEEEKEIPFDVVIDAHNVEFIKNNFQQDLVIRGNQAGISRSSIAGALIISGDDASISNTTVEGALQGKGENATLENVTLNQEDDLALEVVSVEFIAVTMTEEINVIVDAANATFTDTSFPKDLTINKEGVNIDYATVAGDLKLNADNLELYCVDVEGTLVINGKNITVEDSRIDTLSHRNQGTGITLENVEFNQIHDGLYNSGGSAANLLEAGGTFTVNRRDWTFDQVTWPDRLFDVHVLVDEGNQTTFRNCVFPGNLTISGRDVTVEDSTVQGELLGDGLHATLEGVTLAQEEDLVVQLDSIQGTSGNGNHVTTIESMFFVNDINVTVETDYVRFFNTNFPGDVTVHGSWMEMDGDVHDDDLAGSFIAGDLTVAGNDIRVDSYTVKGELKGAGTKVTLTDVTLGQDDDLAIGFSGKLVGVVFEEDIAVTISEDMDVKDVFFPADVQVNADTSLENVEWPSTATLTVGGATLTLENDLILTGTLELNHEDARLDGDDNTIKGTGKIIITEAFEVIDVTLASTLAGVEIEDDFRMGDVVLLLDVTVPNEITLMGRLTVGNLADDPPTTLTFNGEGAGLMGDPDYWPNTVVDGDGTVIFEQEDMEVREVIFDQTLDVIIVKKAISILDRVGVGTIMDLEADVTVEDGLLHFFNDAELIGNGQVIKGVGEGVVEFSSTDMFVRQVTLDETLDAVNILRDVQFDAVTLNKDVNTDRMITLLSDLTLGATLTFEGGGAELAGGGNSVVGDGTLVFNQNDMQVRQVTLTDTLDAVEITEDVRFNAVTLNKDVTTDQRITLLSDFILGATLTFAGEGAEFAGNWNTVKSEEEGPFGTVVFNQDGMQVSNITLDENLDVVSVNDNATFSNCTVRCDLDFAGADDPCTLTLEGNVNTVVVLTAGQEHIIETGGVVWGAWNLHGPVDTTDGLILQGNGNIRNNEVFTADGDVTVDGNLNIQDAVFDGNVINQDGNTTYGGDIAGNVTVNDGNPDFQGNIAGTVEVEDGNPRFRGEISGAVTIAADADVRFHGAVLLDDINIELGENTFITVEDDGLTLENADLSLVLKENATIGGAGTIDGEGNIVTAEAGALIQQVTLDVDLNVSHDLTFNSGGWTEEATVTVSEGTLTMAIMWWGNWVTNRSDIILTGGSLANIGNLENELQLDVVANGDETFEIVQVRFVEVNTAGDPSENLLDEDGFAKVDAVDLNEYSYRLIGYGPFIHEAGDEFTVQITAAGPPAVVTIAIDENTDNNMSGTHTLRVTHLATGLWDTVVVDITDTAEIVTQ